MTKKIKSFDRIIGIIVGLSIVAFVAGIVAYFLGASIVYFILSVAFLPLLSMPVAGKKKYSAALESRK